MPPSVTPKEASLLRELAGKDAKPGRLNPESVAPLAGALYLGKFLGAFLISALTIAQFEDFLELHSDSFGICFLF
ncbi:hypothetical protein A7K93_02540 [Candidatus Methylacidiphilum fumarolicum]|uniref:Uncharacterized protein n=2 Tax=Candidatus Methylacidiphilum fumarolicum TaxID=591154 RepID=I0JVI5_METFB|nr:hypothetical protein [Candidatus Methylacidiphilum fumarolicum]MBW6414845.1 hypothetical protein [Candidatus Methylacidiphilum fumarolicum]TFE68284.1 hypothetical protein A7K73_00665 [Candidatus Methylacidiphilum fumarolicum]TFE73512.1 hypothetical protein A7K72_06305 [Candidatus Methylacidiphilum fumarolicum]TFE75027.1 hypothetical protein A7K93_02540 [Candidatus Methylacidiphilum fumarolicum]TFE76573.1 hypothetical protein A7D33_09545 [Candidatus Methylacidiphilum fumarolicum]